MHNVFGPVDSDQVNVYLMNVYLMNVYLIKVNVTVYFCLPLSGNIYLMKVHRTESLYKQYTFFQVSDNVQDPPPFIC